MEATISSSLFQITEVELIYHNPIPPSQRAKITSSKDSYLILSQIWDQGKIQLVEEFKVMFLDTGCRLLCVCNASLGGRSDCFADPRLIFPVALKAAATSIILAHNHPSGNLKPSQRDLALTNKMIEGGKLLNIQVVDHIILSTEGYYSFSEEGDI